MSSERRPLHPALLGFLAGLTAALVIKALSSRNSNSNSSSVDDDGSSPQRRLQGNQSLLSPKRDPNKQSYVNDENTGEDVRDMKRTVSSGSPNAIKTHLTATTNETGLPRSPVVVLPKSPLHTSASAASVREGLSLDTGFTPLVGALKEITQR
jgi:hypothetical protein